MKLYDYYRSTACFRVRILLNLKNISYEKLPIHLVNNGGEQHLDNYRSVNPQELVPTLVDGNFHLSQSLAIIEYLDELYPSPSIFPKSLQEKTRAREIAYIIACDMHPLNNLRVLKYQREYYHASDEDIQKWYHTWLDKGFHALEIKLEQIDRLKDVCVGDTISIADLCLIPQIYNAHRFNFSLEKYPIMSKINQYCMSLEAFKKAYPN